MEAGRTDVVQFALTDGAQFALTDGVVAMLLLLQLLLLQVG